MSRRMKKVESTPLIVDPFHTDYSGALNYSTLGKHLLNCAENHASKRGFGMKAVNDSCFTWVLSRLAIEMVEMPKVYEKFSISTWVENIYRMFTDRNYSITGEDGKVYGYARSVWAMIDQANRQSVDLEQMHGENLTPYVCPNQPCPIDKPGRVRPLPDDCFVCSINTVYSDIDYNGHVNSIKYIEHLTDLFPVDYYKEHALYRIEMAYMAESYFGDTLSLFMKTRKQAEGADGNNETYELEIRKNYVPGEQKGEPVVRCALFFK